MTTPSQPPGEGDPTAREKCTAMAKRSGKRCTHWPMLGSKVCAQHGGKAPQVMAAAKRRLQEQAAEVAAGTYGLPREVDPGQALLEEVHRTAGHVAWLGARVAQLPEGDLFWGVTEEIDRPFGEDGGGGTETKRKAVPHVLVVQYDKERRHLAAVSKAAIDAGVSERVVGVFEQVATAYVQVLDRVLSQLELTPEQQARVPGVVTGELRAIAGGVG